MDASKGASGKELTAYLAALDRELHKARVAGIDHVINVGAMESETDRENAIRELATFLKYVAYLLWPPKENESPIRAMRLANPELVKVIEDLAGDDFVVDDHCPYPWDHVNNRCIYNPGQ